MQEKKKFERAYPLRADPQLQFIVKVVNIPVVAQRQIPMEDDGDSQPQNIDKVVDVPVSA